MPALKLDFECADYDSAFISQYSELEYNPKFRSHGSFGGEAEDKLFAAEVGQVVGPIAGEGGYGVYKLLGKQTGGQTYYNFSQIVLNMTVDTSSVYGRARQLLGEIQNGASFEDLAQRNSIDPSSTNGGNMGWVANASFIPPAVIEFNKNNAPGTMGIVRGTGGVHIIRVNKAPSNEMIRVSSVIRRVEVGKGTRNEVYGMANTFAADLDAKDPLDFTKKASANGMNIKNASKLTAGAKGWSSLPNAREIVKWAYESKRKEGDISEPFTIGNTVIVARIRKIVEKGTSDLESVRDKVKVKVVNEKKAGLLVKKFKDAAEKSKSNLTAVSLAIAMGTVAQKIENADFYQNTILYIGNDYKVQGAILGMKKGEHSSPISGEQGVYVFFCNSVSTAPTTPSTQERVAVINKEYRQGIETKIDEVLKDEAGRGGRKSVRWGKGVVGVARIRRRGLVGT